jgi:hypothetical protein
MLRSLPRQIVNRLQDTFQILKYLTIPKSDHLDAKIVQESRPPIVFFPSIRFIVLSAIQLNGKLCLMAKEIEDKLFEGMLAAKTKPPNLFAAQAMPQRLFRIGHVLQQRAGRFKQRSRNRRWNEKLPL